MAIKIIESTIQNSSWCLIIIAVILITGKTNAFLYFIKTSKFEWKVDDIRMEKIISATILATKYFLEVSALLDIRHYPKLQSCAISRKYNDATLRKWQKTLTFVSWVLPLLLFRQWFSIILCNFQEN